MKVINKLKAVIANAERYYLHLGHVLYDTRDRAGLLSLLEGCVLILAVLTLCVLLT